MDNTITQQNPAIPSDTTSVEYLTFLYNNGQLSRTFTVLDTNGVKQATYSFDRNASVGDRALKTEYYYSNQTVGTVTTEAIVTQDMIDGTEIAPNLAPTDISLSATTIVSGSAIGTVIGTFSTFDPNEDDLHTYTIISDPDDKFEITGSDLRLKNSVDYNTATSHQVTIRSTDSGIPPLYFDKIFTITVITQSVLSFYNHYAFSLDGSSTYMKINNTPSLNLTTAMTFVCRIYLDSTLGTNTIICNWGGNAGQNKFLVYIKSRKFYVQLSEDGTNISKLYYTTATINSNQWYRFGFTYTGNSLILYLNGTLIATTITTDLTMTSLFNNTGTDIFIGATQDGASFTDYFKGYFDEFAIYNTVLTADQMRAIQTYDVPNLNLLSSEVNLVSWWNTEDPSAAPYVNDVISGNNALSYDSGPDNFVYAAPYDHTSISFDGIEEYMIVGQPTDLVMLPSSPFTIQVLHSASTVSKNLGLIGNYDSVAQKGWYIGLTSNNKVQILISESASSIMSGTSATLLENANTYRNIIITYDGSGSISGIKVYDGDTNLAITTVSDSLSGSDFNSGYDIVFGTQSNILTNLFKGNFKSLTIWDIAFSTDDVVELADVANLTPWYDPRRHSQAEAHLKHYFSFGEGENDAYPYVYDLVGTLKASCVHMGTANFVDEDVI